MKQYKIVIKVHEDEPIINTIKSLNWKSALVAHDVFNKCAIMELSNLWLKDYKAVKQHYDQFDIYIDIMELKCTE